MILFPHKPHATNATTAFECASCHANPPPRLDVHSPPLIAFLRLYRKTVERAAMSNKRKGANPANETTPAKRWRNIEATVSVEPTCANDITKAIDTIIAAYQSWKTSRKEEFDLWATKSWPVGTWSHPEPVLITEFPEIPPLSDPFLWRIFCGCRSDDPNLPPRNSVKYYSAWHTFELIGDKTLSKIVQTMLDQVGLPFDLIASLHEWLTTNKMWRRWGVVLPNSDDRSISDKRDNAYEVGP